MQTHYSKITGRKQMCPDPSHFVEAANLFKEEKSMNNTFMANPDKVERKWYVVDATGYTLGRLSSEIAKILRGKNKAVFTPHIDTGDYVIVVNAEKIKVTGKKLDQKIYYHHSDYVGGMKETTLKRCWLNIRKEL